MAAAEAFPAGSFQLVPCSISVDIFESLNLGFADVAVLPIENSLHGSVFEHYDLLLEHGIVITGEVMLRIRHNVIAAPGVRLEQIRRISSHPVALSQCRRWLRAHSEIEATPGNDTAGSVKELMAAGMKDAAGIAPALAAREYGADVLVAGIEDHPENYTRFYVLKTKARSRPVPDSNKISLAFTLDHRPGTLMTALAGFTAAGLNLTKIESRPVQGRPWEYVFFVDVRFDSAAQAEQALEELQRHCQRVEILGRYRAAGTNTSWNPDLQD